MSGEPPPRRRQLGWWWLWLVPLTALGLFGQLQQAIDPTNRALKDPTSDAARQLRALHGVVASDQVVLLGFHLPGDLPILDLDRERLAACRTAIAALPGVVETTLPPSPEPNLHLLTAALRGHDLGAIADTVVATARRECPPPLQLHATGLPLLEAAVARLVATERTTIVPWLCAALFVAAWLLYRRIGLAIATLLPPLVAIAWLGGVIAWLGHPLDPIAALLEPVLLTIGVATSVHFVEAWRHAIRQGLAPEPAAAAAKAQQTLPTLLATATTMVGLCSMAISSIPAVVDFGVRASLGVALVHTLCFALLPRWLACQPLPSSPASSGPRRSVAARWLAGLHHNRGALLGSAAALTAITAVALPRLTADNDPLQLLPATEPSRLDHDALAARLGGVEVFYLLVPADSPAHDPLRLLPFVADSQLRPAIAGLGGPPLRSVDGELAMPLLLRPGGAAERTPLFASLAADAELLGLDGVRPAGSAVQIAQDSSALIQSLGWSLVVTLGLLGLGMAIGLRSWRLGLLGLVPNTLPCLWIYGGLALLDRPVTVATAMIGCTMLGLIVDNTLHLLHHYRLHVQEHGPRGAVRSALARTGSGMCLSSGMLLVGFATAATSDLATTVEFAVLACTTIAAALVGCAVLLPLWLERGRRAQESSHAD